MKCREEKNLILLALPLLPWIQGFQHANSTLDLKKKKNLGMGRKKLQFLFTRNARMETSLFFFESSYLAAFFVYIFTHFCTAKVNFKMRKNDEKLCVNT